MTDTQKKLAMLMGISEEEFEPAKKTTGERIAELEAQNAALMKFMGVTGKWNGNGVFEVVKLNPQSGDFTDPIEIPENGIEVKADLWYYVDDKDLPHQAKADAFVSPEDFYDSTWFDFVD